MRLLQYLGRILRRDWRRYPALNLLIYGAVVLVSLEPDINLLLQLFAAREIWCFT